jgi:hypothetical protein
LQLHPVDCSRSCVDTLLGTEWVFASFGKIGEETKRIIITGSTEIRNFGLTIRLMQGCSDVGPSYHLFYVSYSALHPGIISLT